MENKTGMFRRKKIYFTQVSNAALRDKKLSLKAKGLYAIIQSYTSMEDFTLYKTTLKKVCKEGEKSFESTWKELKDSGYLIQYKMQKATGQFYYEYELLDQPAIENSEEISQETAKNKESNHTPKKEGVVNQPCGKVGVFKNTDIKNTYLNNTKSIYLSKNNNNNKEKDRLIENQNKINELINNCITEINNKFLNTFKPYESKMLAKTSICDIDLIEYAYDKAICEIEKGTELNNLYSYMIKIIKNELKS